MEIAYLAPKERRKGRGRGSFPDDNDTKGHNLGRFLRDVSFLGCRSRMRLAHVNAY